MHILLIHQAFAALDEPGGTRHHEFARHLQSRGHRVTVIAGQVSYLTGERRAHGWVQREVDDAGVVLLRCYAYPGWHRSFFHRMLSFFSFMISSFLVGLRASEVDLVWGTSPPIFQGVVAWLLARLKRAPFLFEVRDLWPRFAVAVGVLRQPVLIRLSQWLERFLYRRADQLVVNSPGYLEHVQARGGRSIEVVPNGADVAMFSEAGNGAAFRRELGLQEAFIVMYAGAHGISNDLELLLDVAGLLPETDFVLLGDGKEKPSLQVRAREAALDNVHFLPPRSKREMAAALAAADVCVAILKPIPAYKTTYPNKVFDYMAAERPVVLAIDGVIRKVVEEAGAGVFVPPGDAQALAHAVQAMAGNPARRVRMGKSGRAYVERRFDRGVLAERMAGVMERTIAERKRALDRDDDTGERPR
jgi:glycosyltransferase involved in cell wall biosynthesis